MTHSSRKVLRTRRLMVESLERRTLMAGNVTVSVIDGVLHVQGDAETNDVQIRQIPQQFTGEWPGAKYQITGLSRYDNQTQTTTINGGSSVIVEGVKNGAQIGLGQGNNSLRIANPTSDPHRFLPASLPGVVTIGSNAGFDILRMQVINYNSVTISSGAGDDVIDVVNSKLKNFTINSDPVPPPGGTIGGSDNILVYASHITGFTQVYMGLANGSGGGGDWLRLNGNNRLEGGLQVRAPGNSFVSISQNTARVFIGGSVYIRTKDLLFSQTDIGGNLSFTGNNQTNLVDLTSVNVGQQLTVSMLGGNDQLTLKDTTATRSVLDGEDGTGDRFGDEGGNNLGDATITGFES